MTDRDARTGRPTVGRQRAAGPGERVPGDVVLGLPPDLEVRSDPGPVVVRSARERPIRVAIVDDHRLMLDGLSTWLRNSADDVEVVAAVTRFEQLLASPAHPADVVLLDLDLGDDVPAAAKIVQLAAAGSAVVVISTFGEPRRVRECLAVGALGYVPKSEDADEILRAVRAAAEGEAHLSPALAAMLVAEDDAAPAPALSQQERRALVLYASGLPLKSVARQLDISVETAKTYLGRVREKYAQAGREARTKIALHRRAVEDGLLGEATEQRPEHRTEPPAPQPSR